MFLSFVVCVCDNSCEVCGIFLLCFYMYHIIGMHR